MPTTPVADYPQEETAEEEGFSPEDGGDTAAGADQFLRNQNQEQQEEPQEKKKDDSGGSRINDVQNAKDAANDAKSLADKFGGGAKAAGKGVEATGRGAAGAGGAGGAGGGTTGMASGAGGAVAGAGEGVVAGAGEGAAVGGTAGLAGGPAAPITVPAAALAGAVAAPVAKKITPKPVKEAKKKAGQGVKYLLLGCIGGCVVMILLPFLVIGVIFMAVAGASSDATPNNAPPEGSTKLTINKIASPTKIAHNAVNATVTYTITVNNKTATASANVKVKDVFSSAPETSFASEITGYEAEYDIGTIPPGDRDIRTFTVNIPHTDYNPGWLLTNTTTVTGIIDGKTETSSSSATVVIGDIPNCYTFAGLWSDFEKEQMQEAINVLIASPTFGALACAGGSVDLSRTVDGSYYGVTNGAHGITIHGPNLGSLSLRLYILSHESGHVVGNMNPGLMNSFVASGIFEAEGLMPTYAKDIGLPSTNCSPSQVNIPYACYDESFAEMISDYVIYKIYNFPARSWSGYPGGLWLNNPAASWESFNTDRPQHFNFAATNIFGGYVY